MIVSRSTTGVGAKFLSKVTLGTGQDRTRIGTLFKVTSPRAGWLKLAV
jgi:hypothetical protein